MFGVTRHVRTPVQTVRRMSQMRVLNRTPQLDSDYAVGRSSEEATDFAGSRAASESPMAVITERH